MRLMVMRWDTQIESSMTGANLESIQCTSLLEVDWVCLYYMMSWVGW